jgi:hypothetical protein
MGLWKIPEKILLPAEPEFAPSVFEFNGRLANGDHIMAYVADSRGDTCPVTKPIVWRTAVLFRFNADGVLLSCNFDTAAHSGDYIEQDPGRSYQKARRLLDKLVSGLRDEGWVSANIFVRPFFVRLDHLQTGLVYCAGTDDEDEAEGEVPRYGPEVRLLPFDFIFHRPWNTGSYDT